LEELDVIAETMIDVRKTSCNEYSVNVHFTPTVPHCTLATLIGEYNGVMYVTCTNVFIFDSRFDISSKCPSSLIGGKVIP
jgi:hypothetical protein